MTPVHLSRRRIAVCVLLAGVTSCPAARGGDVTTLSGTTYCDVRLLRAEPDGVTWEYATGVVKVDFTDLPEPVCKEFRYSAEKAAAFQAAQARERARIDAQAQQTQRGADARRARQFQAQTEGAPGEFVLRRKAADAQVQQSVAEGIAAKTAAEVFRTKGDGTIWDRRLWAVPKLIFGGNEFDGMAFDPKTDFNSHEYRSSLHHGVISDAKGSAGDAFFQPIYLTKSYNDEIDRAAGFARGRP